MANICGNYLQRVTKDTLENQVGLGICMAQFASHCGIIGAHPKQSRFQLPLHLGAKCLVISQLTIGILGILRRHCIPLATHPHTRTGVNSSNSNNSSSNNNSRSNRNSSKVGRLELAQPNTNLRLTQDGRMQGTMKNLTFVARHVRCAITRKACVNGIHRFGFGVHPSHLPMYHQKEPFAANHTYHTNHTYHAHHTSHTKHTDLAHHTHGKNDTDNTQHTYIPYKRH